MLKRWTKRWVLLDMLTKTLNIRADSNKKEKVIVLEHYQAIWIGKRKGKKIFEFQLKAKNQNNK